MVTFEVFIPVMVAVFLAIIGAYGVLVVRNRGDEHVPAREWSPNG